MKKILALTISCLFWQSALADVVIETLCYVGVSKRHPNKEISLTLRKYFDLDLQRQAGGIAQYGGAPSRFHLCT